MKEANVQMKHFFGFLIVLCAVSATAQVVPSGPFHYSFANTPLWDTTGSYANDIIANGNTDAVIMDLTQSATGKITGTRTDAIVGSGDVTTTITGKVTVKGGVAGAMVKMKGTVTADGYTGPATGKGTATIDPSTLTIHLAGSEKLCVNTPIGKKCETFSADSTYDLPSGINGDWTLDTDITATADKLSGTGTLTLFTGRTLTYQITGSYSTTTEDAKLKLVGEGSAAGSSLSLTTHGTNMDLIALKGKVLGQKPTLP
jgi:hypothetical protein